MKIWRLQLEVYLLVFKSMLRIPQENKKLITSHLSNRRIVWCRAMKGKWKENERWEPQRKRQDRQMKGEWKENERRMKGEWKENERKMKGEWKENERRMKREWKENERWELWRLITSHLTNRRIVWCRAMKGKWKVRATEEGTGQAKERQMKGKWQENERKKNMKGEVGAQRGGWSFERRDWSLLMEVERLELTDGEVGA